MPSNREYPILLFQNPMLWLSLDNLEKLTYIQITVKVFKSAIMNIFKKIVLIRL